MLLNNKCFASLNLGGRKPSSVQRQRAGRWATLPDPSSFRQTPARLHLRYCWTCRQEVAVISCCGMTAVMWFVILTNQRHSFHILLSAFHILAGTLSANCTRTAVHRRTTKLAGARAHGKWNYCVRIVIKIAILTLIDVVYR